MREYTLDNTPSSLQIWKASEIIAQVKAGGIKFYDKNRDGNGKLNAKRVKEISRNFNTAAFGTLTFSRSKSGAYIVTNGHHRIHGMIQSEDLQKLISINKDPEIPVIVIAEKDHVETYRDLNNQSAHSLTSFVTNSDFSVAKDIFKFELDYSLTLEKKQKSVIGYIFEGISRTKEDMTKLDIKEIYSNDRAVFREKCKKTKPNPTYDFTPKTKKDLAAAVKTAFSYIEKLAELSENESLSGNIGLFSFLVVEHLTNRFGFYSKFKSSKTFVSFYADFSDGESKIFRDGIEEITRKPSEAIRLIAKALKD